MDERIPARLTPSEGRKFGLTVGTAFLLLGALLLWRQRHAAAAAMGLLGTLLFAAALAIPTRLGLVQRGWMGLARAISRVTTPIFMGVVFFVVVTPIGLVMRLFGHRPLVHKEVGGGFWTTPASGGRSDLERQF